MTRWSELGRDGSADSYQDRFDRLAAAGHDVHGEAGLCSGLVAPGARVLDAGCGTGRVAVELDRRGYRVTGLDADAGMLARAARTPSGVSWLLADLAHLPDDDSGDRPSELAVPFDLVVAAGNVIPLVARGTEPQVMANLAGLLAPDGLLVTGFGLDPAHLPLPAAPFDLAGYDTWCEAAGLQLRRRFATWDGDPYQGAGYAVSIHTAAPGPPATAPGAAR